MTEEYEVAYTASDKVEATDALQLGALGIDVPEEKIYYNDDLLVDDDDFDGDWVEIESDIEDYKKHLPIKLEVDREVEDWLSSSKIDIDLLVSELITGFYRSSKAIRE